MEMKKEFMDKQNVLFIGLVWPEPNSSAGGIRTMHLIRLFLAQNWKVTFACVAVESEFMADIKSLGVDTVAIELNNESFDIFIQQLNPTIVLFDRFMVEEQFGWRIVQNCPNALRVVETIDLHCLRTSRQQVLKTGEDLRSVLLSSEISKREIASIYRSDLSIIISEAEVKILKEEFEVSDSLLFYLPFLVDSVHVAALSAYEERKGFITIGNFKHEPNWDSVRYLKEIIWPLIRKQMPDVELKIYGSYASEKILQLHNPKEGFYIMGRAEDAKEVMQQARVCLAPLRFGAGIKGKLVDAMLCGTPSITTSIGAEGMCGEMKWNGSVVDDEKRFAAEAVKLYQDKKLWEQAQQNGFALIEKRFTNTQFNKQIIKTLLQIQTEIIAHRQNNFTGSMLLHHTMQSTKFMSKWIEEKNKI